VSERGGDGGRGGGLWGVGGVDALREGNAALHVAEV